MAGRRMICWIVAVCALAASPLLEATRAGADPASDFISKTNALRVSQGLVPLVSDSRLTAIAQRWAAHMAATQVLAHNTNLANELPSDWLKYGENVGDGPSVDAIHQAFVNSPHHYANLVDPDFRSIGVGVVTDSRGALWVVEDFMLEGQVAAPGPPPPAPSRTTVAAAPPPAVATTPASSPTTTVTTTTTTTTTTTSPTLPLPSAARPLPDVVHDLSSLDARS